MKGVFGLMIAFEYCIKEYLIIAIEVSKITQTFAPSNKIDPAEVSTLD